MTVGAELASLAQDYIAGRVELGALDSWLVSHAQELADAAPRDEAARLSGVIEVTLAEMDAGHATEDQLRERVKSFLSGQRDTSTPSPRIAS